LVYQPRVASAREVACFQILKHLACAAIRVIDHLDLQRQPEVGL
jgi:hypothetical protein